jgi:hypothetical protein
MVGLVRNMLENQIDGKLLDIKGEIRTQGESKLNEYKKQLPSKEEIISTLRSEATESACSPQGQAQMEKIYNKLKRKLEKVQRITERTKGRLDNTQSKLDRIKDIVIPKIKKILAVLAKLIGALAIIAAALFVAMGFMVGWAAKGDIIKRVGDLIDGAKTKIGIFKNAIKAFTTMVNKNLQKVFKLAAIMAPIIAAVAVLLTFIISLIAILEVLYLKFLQTCNIGNQDPTDIDGNINTDLLILEGSQIMDDLGLLGDEEVIEKMYNANFQVIGYKRYKI